MNASGKRDMGESRRASHKKGPANPIGCEASLGRDPKEGRRPHESADGSSATEAAESSQPHWYGAFKTGAMVLFAHLAKEILGQR
jgi:hypothetical protein